MSSGPRPNGSAAGLSESAAHDPGLLPDAVALDDDVAEPDRGLAARVRARKGPNAFRTISEVADDLHIPQHVLRFWETKFPQVRPLKRGGGRRYYRPDDVFLLKRISDLLYVHGFTIKGVQRLLRESGGHLSDDIPPPIGDERRDVGGGESNMLPGLLGSPPSSLPPFAPRAMAGEATGEAERLRSVLRDLLEQLEALRALLA